MAALTKLLTANGQTNRECALLASFVGAVQLHMYEPFGILCSTQQRPSSTDHAGHITLLLQTIQDVATAFALARDRTNYRHYNAFAAASYPNGRTLANIIVEDIATNAMARIPLDKR